MISTSIALRNTSAVFRPAFRRPVAIGARPQSSISPLGLGVAGRRWNTQDQRGGKSKLIFRFGLRDIPVELYPMAFVVAAACVGAGIAIGRQLYTGDLRTGPSRASTQR
ncbi:uncharacterized protein L203_100523 [Cryptococcus depauperatus CBS 7841]|uniref:Uncharacterized protein n=1 Tax=Cryptococcus depauperatus CBS 7841 TaxID=1295531 RepID=A0A1E3HRY3_9TREE|nr:hypothetical protein L203_06088 [Cryptococcus depauperatus CBS 7841]